MIAAAASPTMRNGRVMCFWRSLSASSVSSSSSTTSSSRYVNERERVFDMKKRRRKNPVSCSYGGLQAAYIKNCGLVVESYQMVETDSCFSSSFFPWDDLLREYAKKKRMVEARQIFDIMPERSRVSWHVMILGYIKIGDMREAKKLFESSPKAGTVWESMICGYARHGMYKLAQKIFNRRPEKKMLTWQMLDAGHYIGRDEDWEATETMARDKTTATWNLLIEGNLYLGLYDRARRIFDDMDEKKNNAAGRNARSWNLIMAASIRSFNDPLPKMPTMLKKNSSHLWNLMIVDGCPFIEEFEEFEGRHVDKRFEEALTIFHLHMPEKLRNAASWNALIYVHLEWEKLDEARFYFDNMPPQIRNPHSWGLMMAAYLQNGMFDEAKTIFFDKNIRVCDDLHSWILMLRWFVKKKMMVDEARRFLLDNVPNRPLSYYSIARACIKHGFREETKLVLETMQQAIMHTNLNIHQTITFLEEKLKENRPPNTCIYCAMGYMAEIIKELEITGNFSDPDYQAFASKVEENGPMFEYEPHSESETFMQVVDSQIDAYGDFSEIFLKGSCDCCGLLQL